MSVAIDAAQRPALEALRYTDLAAWAVVLLVVALTLGGFLVLRALLHRHWYAPLANRLIWCAELVILPGVVLGGRELLLASPWLAPYSRVVEETGGAVLCLALAWLADRGVTLYVLAEDRSEQRTDIPAILRTAIRAAIYLLAGLAFVTLVLKGTTVGFVVSWSVVVGVLGLALQGTLQDAFAGISLSVEEPFRLGDWIELEDGTVGQVIDISWRATRLMSLNNSVLVIPNSKVAAARIHNFTQHDAHYALWVDLRVSNEVDPAMVRRLLLEAALATSGVLHRPAPSVNLVDGGRRPFRYAIYFHCDDYLSHFVVRSKLFERAWRYLRQVGVTAAPETTEAWLRRAGTAAFREEDPRELLRQAPLFRPLTENELDALQAAVHYRVFPAGTPIVRFGEPGESLFLIAGGQVRVSLGAEYRGTPELARLGVGQYFGETSLLTGAPRTATVTTVTECARIEVGKDALLPVVEARPELGEELARVEAARQLEVERHARQQRPPGTRAVSERAREMLVRIRRFFRLDEPTAASD